MHSYGSRTSHPITSANRAGSLAAVLAIAVSSAAIACADVAAIERPRLIAGPESLSVALAVSASTVASGQSVTFRATARNTGDATVIVRYAAPSCGLQTVIETALGEPMVKIAQACPASAAEVRDTLSPGDSIVRESGIGNLPPGTYRAHAAFLAANGQTSNSATSTLLVR